MDGSVQVTHPGPDIGQPADPPRQRRGDDIADPLMGGRGQQTGLGDRLGDGGSIADATDLHVAPSGEFQRPAPETRGGIGQRLKSERADHSAGQPDAGQCAVGGLMDLQRTGTGVLVAGPAHPLTVRRRP